MQLVLPCRLMASFHHHFCFAWLKPLSFTWHHLNLMKRRRKAGNGHMVFYWKTLRCLHTSREQTKVTQSGAGWKHPAVHEAHHQHVLQASLPQHGEAKPANIAIHSPKGNWAWGSIKAGFLGSWGRRRHLLCHSHKTAPIKGQVMVISGYDFNQPILLNQIQVFMSGAG